MYEEKINPPQIAGRPRLWPWVVVVVALLVLSMLWSLTPLRETIRPDSLTGAVGAFADHPAAPWLVLLGFVLGGLVALPVTLLVVLTVIAFGPLAGFVYALAGATLSALAAFGLGRVLGHRAIARMTGSRIHTLSRRLGEAGILAVAAVRMVPLAHFSVISLVAGATHVRLRSFALGTVLGMTPGIGVIALLLDRLVAVSAEPGLTQYLLLAGASLGMLALLLATRLLVRRLRRLLPRSRRSER